MNDKVHGYDNRDLQLYQDFKRERGIELQLLPVLDEAEEHRIYFDDKINRFVYIDEYGSQLPIDNMDLDQLLMISHDLKSVDMLLVKAEINNRLSLDDPMYGMNLPENQRINNLELALSTRRVLIGMSLKSARDSAGMSLKKVAAALDVDERTIANWEKGKNSIRIEYVYSLAKLYNHTNIIDLISRYF